MLTSLPEKSPPSLAELQRWISWAIAPTLANEPRPSALGQIATGRIPRARRLRAYAEAFEVRMVEALAIDFRAVRAALGESEFTRLVMEYCAACPSRWPTLAEFGRGLPSFLRDRACSDSRWPFLADLAELEWRVAEAYYADDAPPLDAASLALVAPDTWAGARFLVDPSAHWLETRWPVLRVHRLAHADQNVAHALPSHPRRERALILRDLQGEVRATRISSNELQTLENLRRGKTLAEISRSLESRESPEVAAARLRRWFQIWASTGLIRNVILSA